MGTELIKQQQQQQQQINQPTGEIEMAPANSRQDLSIRIFGLAGRETVAYFFFEFFKFYFVSFYSYVVTIFK